jgi:anthranilate phosphoribosyltransferase
VLVVHGDGGVDEVALSGPTKVHEVKDGAVRHYEITPQEAGIEPQPAASIKGGTPEQNAAALTSILRGEAGPLRDVVVLNAAAALIAADAASTLADGARLAQESIDSGNAAARMKAFVELTTSFA